MENKVLIITLLFNKKISESLTYNSILSCNVSTDILILDNSIILQDNCDVFLGENVHYHRFYENIGLSKAYNFAIDNYPNYEYYCTFDDDTMVDSNYLEELYSHISKNIDVVFPKIISDEGIILSPTYSIFDRKKIRPFPINSGTCYSKHVLKNIKFDENLFLYYIDLDIFQKIYKANIYTTKIMETSIVHEFSDMGVFDEKTYSGFLLRFEDARRFYDSFFKYFIFKTSFLLMKSLELKSIKPLQFIFKKNKKIVRNHAC